MRKLISMLLALGLMTATALSVIAAAPQKISGLHPQFAQQLSIMELNQEPVSPGNLEELEIVPGAELHIYLVGDGMEPQLFYDQNGLPVATADVSVSRLRAGQIGVEITDGDSRVVDAIGFGYANNTQLLNSAAPYISIQFSDHTSSTEDVDVDFTLALTQDGDPLEQTALHIAGVMTASHLEVTAADTAIDLADGRVALAMEDVSNIEVSLGEDITVTTDMTAGEKYYGVAWLEQEDSDSTDETGVRRVYALDTINLDGPNSGVRIHSDTTLFVYDENGAYIGTTRDLLPCCSRYYLATKKAEQL